MRIAADETQKKLLIEAELRNRITDLVNGLPRAAEGIAVRSSFVGGLADPW